ncbi:hypothetical protein WJX73_010543 [Symbiochloris irregularis]|uniref:Uncharacterized protein n=1 Tax=Symbiochloris irregularis TaxID=706552 RepID=A0AAW1NZM4_9CHLO
MAGISFAAVDSPYFLQFIELIRPNYTPAGSTLLRTKYLPSEARMWIAARCDDILHMFDYTGDEEDRPAHRRANGAWHFDLVCSDNGGGCPKGRKTLIAMVDRTHMLDQRCMLHGFNLVNSSVFGHPAAKAVIKLANRMATGYKIISYREGEFNYLQKQIAGNFWRLRGCGREATFSLMDRLKDYKDSKPPFNRPFVAGMPGPERIFSYMGWYKSKLRASMHVPTLSGMTMIKQYNMQQLQYDRSIPKPKRLRHVELADAQPIG